jgi:hypothetical protein
VKPARNLDGMGRAPVLPPGSAEAAAEGLAEARAILSCPPRRPAAKAYATPMLEAVVDGHGASCCCEVCFVERTKDSGLGFVARRQRMRSS